VTCLRPSSPTSELYTAGTRFLDSKQDRTVCGHDFCRFGDLRLHSKVLWWCLKAIFASARHVVLYVVLPVLTSDYRLCLPGIHAGTLLPSALALRAVRRSSPA
jgi:hypothetical protein